MKKIFLIIAILLIFSCKKNSLPQIKNAVESEVSNAVNISTESSAKINTKKNTVKERFTPPKDFFWVEEQSNSFGFFIENFKLKKYNAPILKYDGTKIGIQNLHEGIFDIETGTKDLQQCADSVIRLYAEYLYQQKRFDEIKFHFTSGDLCTWNDYKKGMRPVINGNNVHFALAAKADDSYVNFRNYLDLIFNYGGTISLNRETKPVTKNADLKTGDILITPGSPGHVVFVAGVCKNKNGEKRYLLGEGFTPAQSIHIVKNPFDHKISPWYDLDCNASEIQTARYLFTPVNFRRF